MWNFNAPDFGDLAGGLSPGSALVSLILTGSYTGYQLVDSAGVSHAFGGATPLSYTYHGHGPALSAVYANGGNGDVIMGMDGWVGAVGGATSFGTSYDVPTDGGQADLFFTSLNDGITNVNAAAYNTGVVANTLTTRWFPIIDGYRFVARDGGVFSFGETAGHFHGSMGGAHLNAPIVGMAATPTGDGYWLAASDGGIFSFGDAQFFGSTGSIHLNRPIVGMAAGPSGRGYWFVASDGGVFAFGDALYAGSTGSLHLNAPIVGMAATPTGRGYWLVASDGGIFSFGDAAFFGSAGSLHLNKPIVGMTSSPSGAGYWLVASDGGIFSYSDAPFHGSAGNIHLNQPIVGMTA